MVLGGLECLSSRGLQASSKWNSSSLAGPIGNEHEAGKLSFTAPPTTLGYVGRDRGTATTQLGGKPKRFFARKAASSVIDIQDEAVASLPNFQILEVPHTAGYRHASFP